MMAGSTLLELAGETRRTKIKHRIMVLKGGNTSDVFVRVIEVVITAMPKPLMPEKSICTDRKSVETVFTLDCGVEVIKVGNKRMKMEISGSVVFRNYRGRRRNLGLHGQEQWLSAAEASVENAMELNVFGGTKIGLDSKSKDTIGGGLAKCGTVEMMCR
jgi:hypothetical protein